MSYNTEYTDAQSATFQQQVQMSCINAALAVMSELASTAMHTQRVNLARLVLQNPAQWAAVFAQGLETPTAGSVGSASTDAQIDTGVASVWNAYAS